MGMADLADAAGHSAGMEDALTVSRLEISPPAPAPASSPWRIFPGMHALNSWRWVSYRDGKWK